MPERLPAARRRDQLLDVALAVFAERDFHATSMNEVAEAAGITKPVLYQHFGSKRALYLELLDDVGTRLTDRIGKAVAAASGPREQVEGGFEAYFVFVAENGPAFQLLFGGGTRRDPEFNETVERVTAVIAEGIAGLIEVDGLDAEGRLLLAHGIIGLAEGTSRHWMSTGIHAEPAELAARVADLAWRGLRGIAP